MASRKSSSVLQKAIPFKVAMSILFLVVSIVVVIVYLTTSNFDTRSQAAGQRKAAGAFNSCYAGQLEDQTLVDAFQQTCSANRGYVKQQVIPVPQPRPAGVPSNALCLQCLYCLNITNKYFPGGASSIWGLNYAFIDQLCAVNGIASPIVR